MHEKTAATLLVLCSRASNARTTEEWRAVGRDAGQEAWIPGRVEPDDEVVRAVFGALADAAAEIVAMRRYATRMLDPHKR